MLIRPAFAAFALATAALSVAQNAAPNLTSVSAGNTVFGTDIGAFLGATTFYNLGYTGTRSVAANVEGGLAWNGHETTTKIARSFAGTGASATSSAWQTHATSTSQTMAGNGGTQAYQRGIAYGAELWTGNLATSIGTDGSFSTTNSSVYSTYYQAVVSGANGKTADVVSGSWGFSGGSTAGQRAVSAGNNTDTRATDGLIFNTNKTFVFSAGNSGAQTGTYFNNVSGIASGFNSISVGALGPNSFDANKYNTRASFSSYGPNSYFNPTSATGTTGNYVDAVRPRVDVAAPGVSIVGAYTTTGASDYFSLDGTSFSAPIVAGVVALATDAAKDKGLTNALDNRVMTAMIMNSADKTSGWTNVTTVANGVYGTTQALDYNVGAGRVNADALYGQLTNGTTDVAGLGGGTVQAKGWDLGNVSSTTANDYLLGGSLLGGSTFSATLRWNVENTLVTTPASLTSALYGEFADLRLELWNATTTGTATSLLAFSDAYYLNTEHLYFTIPTTGTYLMRVSWMGERYDFLNRDSVGYGLAWNGTAVNPVPEPASFAALALGLAAFATRRRRKA